MVEGVEAFVPDDGTARQAFAEERIPDGARLVIDQRGAHKPLEYARRPAAEHAALWNHLVRFNFAKRDATLDEAIRRLGALRNGQHR
jgi:hypothetical protein